MTKHCRESIFGLSFSGQFWAWYDLLFLVYILFLADRMIPSGVAEAKLTCREVVDENWTFGSRPGASTNQNPAIAAFTSSYPPKTTI
jgi:hypothetical protein